ncbi:MAG: ornithine cyclodeaminase family protein [Chloroflexi bacterium]|nr:ornithine cyclodeaminase family protein [Chloroflexota bacterium]
MDRSVKFLYLSQEDVAAAGGLDMATVLAAVEKGLSLRDKGDYIEPGSPMITWAGGVEGRRVLIHPAWVGGDVDVTGVKWIPSNPANPTARKMPRAAAVIILSDATTGFPIAIMDGTIVSAMRTGAVTGVGAKYLARPDSEVVGLLGPGVQNRTQLMALKEVLPRIREVKIYGPTAEKAVAWAIEMAGQVGLPVRAVASAREAVEGSDVVVAATAGPRAAQPYVEADWLAEGSFFSLVSNLDAKPEVFVHADRVVLDTRDQLDTGHQHSAGSLADLTSRGVLKREAVAELGEIINGKQPPRRHARERIVLKPRGLPVEDVVAAHAVYQQAKARGVGQELYLWREPRWT